jgi:hypothetical protein
MAVIRFGKVSFSSHEAVPSSSYRPRDHNELAVNEASRAMRVVPQSEKLTGRAKSYSVVLTRTSPPIRGRGLTHIQNGMIAYIPVLEKELNERDAFRPVLASR